MPTTLTVADFLSLRMQYKAEQAENEIPAVIEHNFKDGRMVDHYFVAVSYTHLSYLIYWKKAPYSIGT